MKLAHRLILILTLATMGVIGIVGYLGISREIQLIEAEAQVDLWTLGDSSRDRLIDNWRRRGEEVALGRLARAVAHYQEATDIEITWIPGDPGPDKGAIVRTDDHLRLEVPVVAEGVPPGKLVLTRSLSDEREFVTRSIQNLAISATLVSLVLSLCSFFVLRSMVGLPLGELTGRAIRLAEGESVPRPSFRGRRDEIGTIHHEMDQLEDRLVDMREKVVAEQAARIATLEQLRHTDRLATVGTLSAGLAHELGTPLNVVTGRASMIISDKQAGPTAIANAKVIAAQAERMVRLIRQLMDFARRHASPRARADVTQIARQTVTLLSPMAKKSGVVLQVEGGPEGSTEAEVDENQVEQVLANLVVNGIQSMHRGGTLQVGIHRQHEQPPRGVDGGEGDYISVAVRDEGEGISAQWLPHIFDPFFTTKPVGEGTGLGLSVAYGIVRDHGGWIDVDSEVGRGSCFTIHLPASVPTGT